MELISVRELFKNTDSYIVKEITVGGWVRSIRGSKQFGFTREETADKLCEREAMDENGK